MLNSIEDILNLHNNKGEIADAYIDMHFDDKFLNKTKNKGNVKIIKKV